MDRALASPECDILGESDLADRRVPASKGTAGHPSSFFTLPLRGHFLVQPSGQKCQDSGRRMAVEVARKRSVGGIPPAVRHFQVIFGMCNLWNGDCFLLLTAGGLI